MKKFKVEFVKLEDGLMMIKDEARYNKVINCNDIEKCDRIGDSNFIFYCNECVFNNGHEVNRKLLKIIEVEI